MKTMKKRNKCIALILAAALTAGLAGCASGKQTEEKPPAQTGGGVKEDDPSVGDSAETEEKTLKIGWCSLCEDNDFGISSRESFEREAEKMGWETVVLNNNYDGQTAIENMDTLITMQVDGIINFQVDAGVAEVVAGMAKDAGIPMITIDCPHPDTPFFGADNENAGLILGEALGKKAQEEWDGQVDLIILCGAPGSGEVVDLRMQGISKGAKDILGNTDIKVLELDGKSEIETSQKVIADTLTANPEMHHILIGCLNDQSGLGAYNAVVAADREADVFIGSHGCDAPAIANLKEQEANCWVGSVAYFPERYGEYVVPLMDQMVKGEAVPEFSYPDHVFVDKNNIGQYY